MDPVLHDEVLMAGMEHVWIDGRHHFDREIVGADDTDFQARKPARTVEADARRSVIECCGLGIPARSMAGPDERGIPRLDQVLRKALSVEACLEIGELDLLANIKHAPF